jgi:hypothetical protein
MGAKAMTVFLLEPDRNHRKNYCPVDQAVETRVWRLYESHAFSKIGGEWQAFKIEVADDTQDAPPTDYTTLVGADVPIFSAQAVRALGDLLAAHGELLPLLPKAIGFQAFHVTTVLEGIDTQRTLVESSNVEKDAPVPCDPDHGITFVQSEALPEVIGDAAVFALPHELRNGPRHTWGDIFVSDEFVRRVEENDLQGFVFEPVWPREAVEAYRVEQARALAEREAKREARKKVATSAKTKTTAKRTGGNGAKGVKAKATQPPALRLPPRVTWDADAGARLTPYQFLQYLWEAVINDRMSGRWIDQVIMAAADLPDQPLTRSCADAVARLLDAGASRDDLNLIARSVIAEGIWWAFEMLDHPGVQPDDGGGIDFGELANQLMNAGPRDAVGRPGGWPPAPTE